MTGAFAARRRRSAQAVTRVAPLLPGRTGSAWGRAPGAARRKAVRPSEVQAFPSQPLACGSLAGALDSTQEALGRRYEISLEG